MYLYYTNNAPALAGFAIIFGFIINGKIMRVAN